MDSASSFSNGFGVGVNLGSSSVSPNAAAVNAVTGLSGLQSVNNMNRLRLADPEFKTHKAPAEPMKAVNTQPDSDDATAIRLFLDYHRMTTDEINRLFSGLAPNPAALLVEGFVNYSFSNWGETVHSTPSYTFVPHAVAAIQMIVQLARRSALKVRCAGYRHSWSPLFGDDGSICISFMAIEVVEHISRIQQVPIDPTNDLQGVEYSAGVSWAGCGWEDSELTNVYRIGAGTTNSMLREWSVQQLDPPTPVLNPVCIPLNVIMVEITLGGSNAPVCHGAGLKHKTLSDLVRAMEIVNEKGEVQIIKVRNDIQAAAGCYGLLGVVIALHLQLIPMRYAQLRPKKPSLGVAVPPPPDMFSNRNVAQAWKDATGRWLTVEQAKTDAQLAQFTSDFVQTCEGDYYSEFFWFVGQSKAWVNSWKADGRFDEVTSLRYPSSTMVWVEGFEQNVAQVVNDVFKWTEWLGLDLARTQSRLMNTAAMAAMPPNILEDNNVVPVSEALHFRRGIQNMRVHDCEWEITIPSITANASKARKVPGQTTDADWQVVQRAWWEAICMILEDWNSAKPRVPVNLVLEMRITGGSDVLMAPQRGNNLGTCSIEILSTQNRDVALFQKAMQDITDRWAALRDDQGRPVTLRPHMAKMCQGLMIRGKTLQQHVQANFPVKDFSDRLVGIASKWGCNPPATSMFTNQYLVHLLFNETSSGTGAVIASGTSMFRIPESGEREERTFKDSTSVRLDNRKDELGSAPSTNLQDASNVTQEPRDLVTHLHRLRQQLHVRTHRSHKLTPGSSASSIVPSAPSTNLIDSRTLQRLIDLAEHHCKEVEEDKSGAPAQYHSSSTSAQSLHEIAAVNSKLSPLPVKGLQSAVNLQPLLVVPPPPTEVLMNVKVQVQYVNDPPPPIQVVAHAPGQSAQQQHPEPLPQQQPPPQGACCIIS